MDAPPHGTTTDAADAAHGTGGSASEVCCTACKQRLRPNSQEGHAVGTWHECKECKGQVHSYIMCDAVFMPDEDKYFCSALCIKTRNSRVLQLANEHRKPGEDPIHPGSTGWGDFVRENELFTIRQQPSTEGIVDATCFLEGIIDLTATTENKALDNPDKNIQLEQEASAAALEPDDNLKALDNHDINVELEEESAALESDDDLDVGGNENGNTENLEDEEEAGEAEIATPHCEEADEEHTRGDAVGAEVVISNEVIQLTTEGNRIKVSLKQHDTDEDGTWFDALVGPTKIYKPFSRSVVTIGYDADGVLEFWRLEEVQVNALDVRSNPFNTHAHTPVTCL